jgi:hypothetical protein
MNVMSTLEILGSAYPLPAKSQPVAGPRAVGRVATHTAQMQALPYLLRLYRLTPGNKGAYALRRIEGDTAHFLMVTFWESEATIRAFAGDDISGDIARCPGTT